MSTVIAAMFISLHTFLQFSLDFGSLFAGPCVQQPVKGNRIAKTRMAWNTDRQTNFKLLGGC